MAFPVPPLDSSILAYNPYFPNGVVSGDWAAYFTALQAVLVSGPVTSFNGRFGVVVPLSGDYTASEITYTQQTVGGVASNVNNKLQQIINLSDYGVKADGVTDDTAAVQAAFNALVATTSGSGNSAVGNYIIYAPKGTILLSATIAPANSTSQFELVGQGKRATVFKWTGAAGIPMFKFTNCREAVFRDFGVIGNAATPPSYGILIYRDVGQVGSGAATSCQFHNLLVGGDSASMMTTGIGYAASSVTYDTNNDLGLFVGCYFGNLISYGVSFEHGNSLLHRLIACDFSNCGGAAINSVNTLGTSLNSSFDAFDCASAGCAYTWRVGGTTHSISIFGWKGEGDTNILQIPTSVGATYTLNMTLHGCSWIGASGTATLTFDATSGSTLMIQGGKWTAPTGVALSFPTTGSRVRIEGAYFNTASISYNNEVDMVDNYVAAGAPTYTNLGSGVLRLVRSDGASNVNALPTITSGTSFSASGLSNSLVILNYAGATTLSSITNGYPGQILTLRAVNSNATIAIGSGADQLRLAAGSGATIPLMTGQQITIQRQDAANGNTWVEISRSSNNQVFDLASGASLYSGRLAVSGTLGQWGPINGTTTSSSFGNGAVVASLGSYIESLSSGALNVRTGTTNILAAQFDATGNFNPKFYTSAVVGTPVASAATITPTGPVFHITGTAAISTINLPYVGFTGTLRVIADGAWTTTTSGNIGSQIIAVANQEYAFTYDGTKWYATSYGAAGGVYSGAPANPTGTTSLTAVMMGLGGAASITPTRTGRIQFFISGQMVNNTNNDGATVQLRYGTGAAPANGVAVTGTQAGNSQTFTAAAANGSSGFSICPIVSGLTIGTPYWFDAALNAVTGGTASITGITISAHEI